jgi:hypothetical protein
LTEPYNPFTRIRKDHAETYLPTQKNDAGPGFMGSVPGLARLMAVPSCAAAGSRADTA